MIVGIILALVFFVSALIMLTPARVVVSWITDDVPQLKLSQVEGTVWNTQVNTVQYQQFSLNNVEMSNSFWSLLLGELNSDISVDDEKLRLNGNIVASTGEYQLTNTNFAIDTQAVTAVLRLPIDGLSGQVDGFIEKFTLSDRVIKDLQGNGEWHNAVIKYPGNNLELGNIRFTLSKSESIGEGAHIDIVDNRGVLDLQGYIEISLDKKFVINLNTTAELPSNLKSWVTRWGKVKNDRIYLEWRGRLP